MRTPACLSVALLTVFFGLAAAPGLRAQEAPSPGGPPPESDAPSQPVDIGETQTLKVNVNLVNLFFSVRDKNGFITNLHKDDCQIFEDKAEQKVKNFTQEKNLPLTIGILLDTSGSQQNVLPLEQEAGAQFLKDVLTPKDEAFLISFDINVDLLADYTNSPREIKRALDKASINTGATYGSVTGNGSPRGTLLYDAVYLAAHDKLHQEAGRKILIILTDGQDQGSQENLKSSIEAAQKSNAIVYVILIADRGFYGGMGGFGYTGAGDMDRLAKETGGRVINVGNNGKKLEDAFNQIQDELRTQYLASYTPTNLKLDGTFRTLNITCGKDTKVQARKGYYALADSLGNE
ncbi:MAG: VWA domain-containing protein [Edaphobacter sp.]|uniref:VWA domain-containing protein n=1 Tax=Edaphobacter sp. TaxID=1934404 RepID=UPI002397BE3C|nr:VWA domain-containing protein [Edaphobacter sp.]MDE1175950.1 VWA domain-containing protein [Edaphobacter sp.]